MCVCFYVCVCVCEREREREGRSGVIKSHVSSATMTNDPANGEFPLNSDLIQLHSHFSRVQEQERINFSLTCSD